MRLEETLLKETNSNPIVMKQPRLTLMLLSALLLSSCCKQGPDEAIPAVPDYADSTQWYIVDRQASVDLFYIVSTETGDYTVGDLPCHYADTYSDSVRAFLLGEMTGIDNLLSGELNYFSPYYRQCTLQSFTSDSLVEVRTPLARGDVREAFAYYLTHLNEGRPFILAGFSQGAMAVVDLLKNMDDEAFNRMVAAYVIGWKVTEEDLDAAPRIYAAHDSNDVGVTICYNSVRTPDCAIPMISDGNVLAINPMNWCTDATPITVASPLSPDTLTIVLDTVSRLVTIDGYSRKDYILPLIGKEGNYHSLEISLYAQSLRRNIALRASMANLLN